MYRFDDRRRRQLLEDALVEFLLDGRTPTPSAAGQAAARSPTRRARDTKPEPISR
jgi:hypothetical protein